MTRITASGACKQEALDLLRTPPLGFVGPFTQATRPASSPAQSSMPSRRSGRRACGRRPGPCPASDRLLPGRRRAPMSRRCTVTLRHHGVLHTIGIVRTHILMLVQDTHVRIVHATTGEFRRSSSSTPTAPTTAPDDHQAHQPERAGPTRRSPAHSDVLRHHTAGWRGSHESPGPARTVVPT